jgi:hypothetical protein
MKKNGREKKKKKGTSEASNAKAGQKETVPAYSMEESFSYVGADSTAVSDILIIDEAAESNGELAVASQWSTEVVEGDSQKELSPEEILKQGIKVAEALAAEVNRVINIAQRSHAERAIVLGHVCIVLKQMVKKLENKTLWEPWAVENLPFIGVRNREKFMRLAKRRDCHRYAFLGVDRLDMLVAATEDLKKENDPIGKLLKKYRIEFDEKSDMEIGDFKRKIDAAIAAERLEEEGLKLDFQLIQDVINMNGKIDTPLINRLKDLEKCDGKPKKLLEDLILSGGKKHGSSPDERPQDFNKLSADLIKTIDYLIEEPDYIDNLDEKIFDKLLESLKKLKKLYGAGNVTKKTA